jgi:uncharacterized membrane protein YgdD (TMEM256/DUF423 family)
MSRRVYFIAAVLAGLAVVLGAFAAHGLKKMTQDESVIANFHTAAQYQFYHALALFIVGFFYERTSSKLMLVTAKLFLFGIFFFSGSLYAMAYLKTQLVEPGGLVYLTPLGGFLFIVGWLLMAISFVKKN